MSRWSNIPRLNVAAVLSLAGIALVCLGAYGDKNIEGFIGFACLLCGFVVGVISIPRKAASGSSYPFGIDCLWLASDRNGHVGAFFTAGWAPIPTRVLTFEDGSIEDIEERVNDLPRISTARLLIPDDVPSYMAMAERGLFVYDWTDAHRSLRESTRKYELVAVPANPIVTADPPELLIGFATRVTLNDLAFVDGQAVDIISLTECCEEPP